MDGMSESSDDIVVAGGHVRLAAFSLPRHLSLGLVSLAPVVVVEMARDLSHTEVQLPLEQGSIATLADVACGIAAGISGGYEPGVSSVVTSDLHMHVVRGSGEQPFQATAEVIARGRRCLVVKCRIVGARWGYVAQGDGSSAIMPAQ